MPAIPENYRRTAWVAWRCLALVVALTISQWRLGMGVGELSLTGAAAAAWVLIGWNALRPGRVGTATAALVLFGAVYGWHLPGAIALFIPIWLALFWLPGLFRENGAAAHASQRITACASEVRNKLHPIEERLEGYARVNEAARLVLAAGAGLLAMFRFLHDGIMGGIDARWYTLVVADHLEQWRAGMGPAFVGQTRYALVGTVMPLRVAPYLQHLTLAIDLATGRALSPYLVLNLAIVVTGVAAGLSAYLCLRMILPSRRVEALLLAVLYVWCPAVIGLAYTGQLFMSVMALPYIPIAFAGVVRIFLREGFTGWAMVAAGCAGCWLAHSPIGLWVTALAGLALFCRWAFGLGWNWRERRNVLGAALLFAGLCGYVFVSIKILAPAPTAPTSKATLSPILGELFPAVLLPVSREAGLPSDLQPGWSILALAMAGMVAAFWRRSMAAMALSIVMVLILCLSFPVPLITDHLWRLVPQAVVDVTNAVPSQRLYPILAACATVLAAAAISGSSRRRGWIAAGLLACVAWSFAELRPFLHRGTLIANTRATSEELLAPQNLILAAFSNSLFGGVNRFFSYGYMDYGLEQRVLDRDMKHYIVSDVDAVARGFDFGDHAGHRRLSEEFHGTLAPDGRRWIDLSPHLTLQPGAHYLLAIDFPDEKFTGVLQIQGTGLSHEYVLPISGESFAFGVQPENSRVIPLSNDSAEPVELRMDFVVQDPSVELEHYSDFARYELIAYDPRSLPIRLRSLLPFVVDVRTPAAGWLQLSRFYTAGWSAMVDGRPSAVRSSKDGLICVPVESGESEVTLVYRPPALLLVAYRVMLATWAGLVIAASTRLLRR